ncbi:dTDP-glucose 4,6-dehydratase [Legionella impletisoli]|uniref:dTDP-glucose 4,6-dehydratase n=1 Tax=Legionella impletisoli TaxID=343510 RepID=A0A917NAM1_9GAMM|nr:dTDP-glucose 4,6-dehydratase [Legionella impletisoli]GGI82024.1 dTDP-glucose 4,6-dehydratase [Legionella impletisoli]
MILVTGGAGFIGSNFIYEWLSNYASPIVNVDKLTYASNLQNLEVWENHKAYNFIHGDIGDSDLIKSTLDTFKPLHVVNFAAETHVDRSISSPEEFIQTNIVGTSRLLESVRRYWDNLEKQKKEQFRFLHVSTDEVYGALEKHSPPFAETNRYQPNSPYSASKAASDHLVRAYYQTYGLPALTTNCSNNYGPFQYPEKLIPLVIVNALLGKSLAIYGDGQQIRDWLYVKDHCRALCRVLESGVVGEVYNIGGLNEKTNLDVVQTICCILDELRPRDDGKSYKEQITFVKDRLGHDRRYAINADKIEQVLGWKPQESFDTGICKTVQWYLNNELWLKETINKNSLVT